ncbi:MAG: hypothetical protein J6U99_04215 [Rikenellaceae bacterium]|nr:hypothetical protein [Rikenellaceae bacterium]
MMVVVLTLVGTTTFASAQDVNEKKYKYAEEIEEVRSFEKMSLVQSDGSMSDGCSGLERAIIRQGDSTRYKTLFKTSGYYSPKRIYIEGVGEATSKDISNGRWEITLKPEKTTKYRVVTENSSGGRSNSDVTVIVLESEKYDSVMQLRSLMNSQQKSLHYRELKGEKVDPWRKFIINKMAKMTPEERKKYADEMERKYVKSKK